MKDSLKFTLYHTSAAKISITNKGQDIACTDFWESSWANTGLLFMSTNAGAFRLLVPKQLRAAISEMKRGVKCIIISRGKFNGRDCIEWLAEDYSQTPFVLYFETKACDRLFTLNDTKTIWTATVWDCINGQPYKCFEVPAYCRFVDTLPYLKGIPHAILANPIKL